MPEYIVGGKNVRRKNFYMPCIISARVKDLPEEEYAALLKATYWADNITNGEWPVVLSNDEATSTNKYRLKKKAAGWVMALARISVLNPELFKAITELARQMYVDQVEQSFPWSEMASDIAGISRAEPGGETRLVIYPPKDEDEDDLQG